MQTTALMWLAFELTHESRWPALIMMRDSAHVPVRCLGRCAGRSLAEATLIFTMQTAFMIQALVLAGLVFSGTAGPWQLLLLTVVSGTIQAIDLPARLAFVVDLAGATT